MEYHKGIRQMLCKAGKSLYQASLDMGRKDNFLGMALTRDMRVSTLLEIASVCGYRLTLTSADDTDTITLDTGASEQGTTRQDG